MNVETVKAIATLTGLGMRELNEFLAGEAALNPRPNVYAVCTTAQNVATGKDVSDNVVVLHHNEDELRGDTFRAAHSRWPHERGWTMHTVTIRIVPRDVIDMILTEFGGGSVPPPTSRSKRTIN